jgi:hypothetical protein
MNKRFNVVALCQGMTLVVPKEPRGNVGFSPCGKVRFRGGTLATLPQGLKPSARFCTVCGTTEVMP